MTMMASPGSSATGMSSFGKMTGSKGFNPSYNIGKSKGGYRPTQLQQFTPEQIKLFQQMFGQVAPNSFLSRLAGGDQSMFEEMEAPAMKQFGELQGQLASRFSGMGTGARKGSGFANTMNQATSDFAQALQAQRLGLQRQAISDLAGLSGQLLEQRPFATDLMKKEPGFLKSLLLGGLGSFAGGFSGGFGGGLGKSIFGGGK